MEGLRPTPLDRTASAVLNSLLLYRRQYLQCQFSHRSSTLASGSLIRKAATLCLVMAQSHLHHMCTVIHWLQTVHVSKHHHPTALCHYPFQDFTTLPLLYTDIVVPPQPGIGCETDKSLFFLPRHHHDAFSCLLRTLPTRQSHCGGEPHGPVLNCLLVCSGQEC